MTPVYQPEGSSLCGQACIASVAGVSLARAIEAVGHRKRAGTTTADVVRGLAKLGYATAGRLKRVSRTKPTLPRRAVIAIHRPAGSPRAADRWHWLLTWDGKMHDPGGRWPDGYKDWRITSYLEIYGKTAKDLAA